MQITIITSKANADGTVALKLAKGADRIELIRMEGKPLDLKEHFEHAIVQPEADYRTSEIMDLLDRIQEIRKGDSDSFVEVTAPECEGCERKAEFEKKVQTAITEVAQTEEKEIENENNIHE